MAQGNYTEAIQDFTISIERKDMLQASYFTRGVCLLGDNQYEKGLMDIEYAIGLNDDEEITKQAQLLIAELETAQVVETLSPEETAKMAERAQLEETLKPKETEPSKEILQPEPGQSINQ